MSNSRLYFSLTHVVFENGVYVSFEIYNTSFMNFIPEVTSKIFSQFCLESVHKRF